jgi:transcriptional regulator with XRE-family HTH domain
MTETAVRQDGDDEERRRLGDRLRDARKYLGLKQEEVATYLKIPRTALTDIENGQRRVEDIEFRSKLISTSLSSKTIPVRRFPSRRMILSAPLKKSSMSNASWRWSRMTESAWLFVFTCISQKPVRRTVTLRRRSA